MDVIIHVFWSRNGVVSTDVGTKKAFGSIAKTGASVRLGVR